MKFLVRNCGGLTVLALVALLVGPWAVQAQEVGRIAGQVVSSATARPLAGAQVVVEGPRIGALANDEGRFLLLNVPAGTYTVRVELIGYESASQQVNVVAGETTTLNFSLDQTAISLEEIVVTGTAAQVRAREVGNSLTSITSQDVAAAPVTNTENILGARAPGVTVIQASGQPGTGGTVRIRGQTTASQTPEPLIYVDGVRVYNTPVSLGSASRQSISPLQDIPASDIERIEVVKGASATTLYGTEAAGGVIQIFTKRGVAGDAIWNGGLTLGASSMGQVGPDGDPTELFTKCDRLDDMYGISQGSSTAGDRTYFQDPTCPSSGRWFETGLQQRYDLSVRGGSDRYTYYVAGNYSDVDGTLQNQNSKDGGVRANVDLRFGNSLNFQYNGAYTRRVSSFVEDGNNADGFLLNVGRGTNGNFKGGKGEDCANVDVLCVTNAYIFDSENIARTNRYTNSGILNWEPIQNFNNKLSVGWDYLELESDEWIPFGYLRNEDGFYSSESNFRSKLSLEYAGSYRNNFGENFLSTISFGGQLFRDRARAKYVDTQGFAGPGKPLLTSGGAGTDIDDSILSVTTGGFFAEWILGFQDRLFLTLGGRGDGSSAFGDDFGTQFYPKAAVSWVVSDYDFWPTDWWDAMKVRTAYGESGKAPGVFDKIRTWNPVTGDGDTPGFTPGEIGNENVGPERTAEWEFGADASLLNGRLGIEATFYSTTTTDALVPVTYPPSQGFLASRTENVGEISGKGYELYVTGVLLQSDAIEWRGRVSYSHNENEAKDLQGQIISGDNKAEVREGYAVPSYFGRVITNPNDFADPVVETSAYIGPVNPTDLIGIGTDFTLFRNWTVDLLMEYQGGHYLPQYTGYQNGRRGVWYPCYDIQAKIVAYENGDAGALNDVTAQERGKCAMNAFGGANSDYWVESADFWKLRSVSLTYDVPQQWVQSFANRMTVTASASNLFIWTDYSGVDPEVEDFADRAEYGVYDGAADYGRREYYNLPAPRTFLLTFRMGF
jgi:TonB-linked SusC/RagA family outer membrane protein